MADAGPVDKPPLHTLPHDELLAKLHSLTNLRAVRDPTSSTGWTIELGPFPGWREPAHLVTRSAARSSSSRALSRVPAPRNPAILGIKPDVERELGHRFRTFS